MGITEESKQESNFLKEHVVNHVKYTGVRGSRERMRKSHWTVEIRFRSFG